MDENTPAFILELEIDDEISFKPMKNKRPLQTLDANIIPTTPDRKRQLQKLTNTSSGAKHLQISTPSTIADSDSATPILKNSQTGALSIPVYSNQLQNEHKPKYSQAEVDAFKIEWQKESNESEKGISKSIRAEMTSLIEEQESQCNSLKLEKSILEKQIVVLQSALLESRGDISCHLENQIKVLSDQIQDAKGQNAFLLQQHEEMVDKLKSGYEKRITEMIKSHATSILAMQERITEDISSGWQQKLNAEQALAAQLKRTVDDQFIQIEALHQEKVQAVKDAKKKMYDKITCQFDAGNKKYDALKKSYKESQENLEHASSQIVALKEEVGDKEKQTKELKDTIVEKKTALSSIESGLINILKSFDNYTLNEFDLTQESVRCSVFDFLQKETTLKDEKIQEANTLVEEQGKEITRLKDIMLLTNSNLSAINEEKDNLNSSVNEMSKLIESAKDELASCKMEKDSQMLVIANMITEKGKVEADLEKCQYQNQELTHRCEDLRKMNDEVMSMLEKVYEEKK